MNRCGLHGKRGGLGMAPNFTDRKPIYMILRTVHGSEGLTASWGYKPIDLLAQNCELIQIKFVVNRSKSNVSKSFHN